MSGVEDFLARWSQRKREAALRPAVKQATPLAPPAAEAGTAPDPARADGAAPETGLPPIESITAATDLAPFLAPGVSAELTRAALRRAWTTDPTIRDFVGLCENGWDFNAPGGVPGFGALTGDQVRRLVAALEREPDTVPEPDPAPPAPAPVAAASEPTPAPAVSNVAAQHEDYRQNPAPLPSSRRHGGALPQ